MSNPIQTTPQITKAGTGDNLQKEARNRQMKSHLIDGDAGEMMTQSESIVDFMNRVELTRGSDDIIEAPENIIKHFQPRGLGPSGFFTYKGLIVCPLGKRDDVETTLSLTREQIMHGKR